MSKLTKDEWQVLEWVAREDVSPTGPVEGDAFRHLVALGLLEVEGQTTFLTDYGWEVWTDAQDDKRDAAEVASMSWGE